MKQKLVSILLVLCMVVALVPAIALTSAAANTVEDTNKDGTLPEDAQIQTGTATAFSGGDGTAENPYQIKDVTEFRYFQTQAKSDASYLALSYILTGNIYFNAKLDYMDAETGLPTNVTLKNANAYTQISGTFSGTFDGDGYGIYNTYARFANAGALFGTVTGTIKNLSLYGGYVYFGGGAESGSLAQTLNGGTLSNCYSSVGIYAKGSATGGLIGKVLGNPTIEDCTYAGAISAPGNNNSYQIGGIVARAESALTISRCANYAPMSTQFSRVGGMIGLSLFKEATVTITDCVNYGDLTSTTSKTDGGVGGMVGYNMSTSGYSGVINYLRCANYGDITASSTVSATGMAGESGKVTSYNSCANYGNVTGKEATAGIHRTASGSDITITNCYSEGTFTTLSTTSSAGLVVGWIKNRATLKNCVGTGAIALFGGQGGEVTLDNNQKYDAGALNMAAALAILNTDLETPVWVAGASAPELTRFYVAPEVPEITIDGASLTIGGNVTLNLFVKKTTVAAAGVTLGKISIVDNDNTPYEVTDDSGDYYVFTIKGLHASEFGKNKIYHVQYTTADAPGTPIDCTATKEYSPLQYAINMYNADDKTETVTDLDKLLLSIVNYADAAAKTTVASTAFKTAHADADFSTLPTFEAIIAKDTGVYDYDEKRKDDQHLPSISANLTETIALTLTFDGSDLYQTGNDNMMMIGNAEIPGKVNTLSVVFSELFATDLYNTITFTFVETYESGLVVTATTSLVQFLKSYQGTTEEALAAATAQYLYVARLFCLNNQPNA